MKNIDKKAIEAIDGLLNHITVEKVAQSLFSGKIKDLEDVQSLLIKQGHRFIIDGLKVIKAAKSKPEYKKYISTANSEWSDMI